MGDFRFPPNGQPGPPPQLPPPRDQDPNMPMGGASLAPPMSGGDVWQAPGTGYGAPPVTWGAPPTPRPSPNGSRFGAGGPLPQGGPAYSPPVRQPMGPPRPQIKPQVRPGGPGMTSSAGSVSRGLGGGTTPPVRQPPDPNKQPPPYPGKYPRR